MLISLLLRNFKKHENLSVEFTQGLNVFRAPNENGKSSVYDAIRYALWGARALPDSLEETVTWGFPVSSLKVTLVFSLANVTYKITRSKSGAELTSSGLVVSGHSEVTAFVERITGADASTGMMTLVSPQGGLQNSLKSSAVELIEKLSNVELIDKLVVAVQSNLPCGNTKLLEHQLQSLSEIAMPVYDVSSEIAEKEHAAISIENLRTALATAQSKLAELEPLEKAAISMSSAEDSRIKMLANVELRLQRAHREVQWPIDDYTGPSIEELEQAIHHQRDDARVRAAWDVFNALPHDYTEITLEQVREKLADTRSQLKLVNKQLHAAAVDLAMLKASLILADSCNLCGKSLSDVKEVVESNASIRSRMHVLQEGSVQYSKDIAALETVEVSMQLLENKDAVAKQMLGRVSEFVSVSYATIPPTATWVGPSVASERDTRNLELMLRSRRTTLEQNAKAVGAAQAAQSQVSALQAEVSNLKYPLHPDADYSVIEEYTTLRQALVASESELKSWLHKLEKVSMLVSMKQDNHKRDMAAYEEKLQLRESLKRDIATYVGNNQLIKKLRETRPVVARELWNLVSVGVSHTFSQIRGVPSVVTRADDRFLIDGKSASVYSGSTKDSLGLAIRLISQKIFLPNVDFMMLDEPASGTDVIRETAMLSALATAGLPQVILVTHSELADTFASNLIVI